MGAKRDVFIFSIVRVCAHTCACVCAHLCVRVWVCDCSKIRSSVFLSQMRIFTLSIPCCFFFIPLFTSLSRALSLAHSHAQVHAHTELYRKKKYIMVYLLLDYYGIYAVSQCHICGYTQQCSQSGTHNTQVFAAAAWNLITLNIRQNITPAQLQLLYSWSHYMVGCSFCLDS